MVVPNSFTPDRRDCDNIEKRMESEKLKELVEGLTLSGSPVLDEAKIRTVKRLCKRSEDNVKEVFKLTMTQLAKEHSEIRLSTFMIIDQIFQRSHRFRTLIVKNLNRVICSVLEVHSLNPLPPPQEAAEALRVKAIVALDEWHEKFGNAYKRIKLAYHYLSTCHKIDFVTVTAHNRSQQLMLKQREDQRKKMQREALEKTRAKVIEEKTSLNIWVRELEAGLAILMPTMTNICSNFEFDAEDFEAEAPATESEAMRQHALGSSYNLEIDLNAVNSKRVAVSDKNAELVRNMDEIAKEIEKKKFKNIKKHILSLTKNEGSQSEVVELVKLREKLESVVKKYQSLDLKRPPPKPVVESQESEDDDEFEDVKDVNEKEGFEPRIPQHLRAEYGLDTEAESSGKPVGDSAGKATPTKLKKPRQRLLAAPVAKKRKAAEEVFDPTSASATLKILKESGKLEKLKEKMKTETGEASACGSQSGSSQPSGSSSAPVVQYDRDLYYLFENPEARMPTVERNESLHRFWTPREETEHALPASLEAGLKMRKMHFTGKFVPVQHKCNVVLPSGKLCPRMDRWGKLCGRNLLCWLKLSIYSSFRSDSW